MQVAIVVGGVLLTDKYCDGKDNKKEYKENEMNYNLVNFCEFDKYAVKSYCAIHGVDESKNLGDITQVDIEALSTNIDLITHGSPCQSFSVVGKQHGGEKGSGTRSSLLWNSVEIIKHCKPKFVIWENVKNVLSQKHKPVFDSYVDEMKNSGYNTYYGILNAKNYGIPQNRERIYAISVREDIDNNPNYTGHIDHNKCYDRSDCSLFPKPFDNGLRLKDFLEDKVDEKYYLSDKMIAGFVKHNKNHEAKGTGFKWKPHDIDGNASCLRANAALAPTDDTIKQVAQIYPNSGNPQAGRIYDSTGISPSMDTCQGGNRMPKIEKEYRIRKLTPKECWRLMGFSDKDFDKAASTGNSNSQLYKQAGNSIVVNVLEEIYKCLIKAYPNDFAKDMNVISLFSGIGAFEKALERVEFNG